MVIKSCNSKLLTAFLAVSLATTASMSASRIFVSRTPKKTSFVSRFVKPLAWLTTGVGGGYALCDAFMNQTGDRQILQATAGGFLLLLSLWGLGGSGTGRPSDDEQADNPFDDQLDDPFEDNQVGIIYTPQPVVQPTVIVRPTPQTVTQTTIISTPVKTREQLKPVARTTIVRPVTQTTIVRPIVPAPTPSPRQTPTPATRTQTKTKFWNKARTAVGNTWKKIKTGPKPNAGTSSFWSDPFNF